MPFQGVVEFYDLLLVVENDFRLVVELVLEIYDLLFLLLYLFEFQIQLLLELSLLDAELLAEFAVLIVFILHVLLKLSQPAFASVVCVFVELVDLTLNHAPTTFRLLISLTSWLFSAFSNLYIFYLFMDSSFNFRIYCYFFCDYSSRKFSRFLHSDR